MTYSIVARDPVSGEMGVAVQSHWFSVGTVVPWGEAGVGVVATQAFADPGYGPRGLELMRKGKSAPDALSALVAADRAADSRQVAMVDSSGRAAVHTGRKCVAAAGHRLGPQLSAQANLMERPTVWDAMARTFESAEGELAERLVAALDAAEAEGGDIRGRQSAALLVVGPKRSSEPWKHRLELRVEDSRDPNGELRRVLALKRAYDRMERGDELAVARDNDGALAEYAAAHQAVTSNPEPAFWHAAMLAQAGRLDEGRRIIAELSPERPEWRELVTRLPAAGLMDAALAEQLLEPPAPQQAPPPQPEAPPPPAPEPSPPAQVGQTHQVPQISSRDSG